MYCSVFSSVFFQGHTHSDGVRNEEEIEGGKCGSDGDEGGG